MTSTAAISARDLARSNVRERWRMSPEARSLVLISAGLLVFGLAVLYSASAIVAINDNRDGMYFLWRQLTGVAAAVPATAAKALTASGSTEKEPRLPEDASVDVPVVAHVRDVRKGLVSLYTGEREITIKNRRLAAALYHASR